MHLPALTGIRFFAIFHIFLFHLWVLFDLDKPQQYATLMSGIGDLPKLMQNFIANGWMSTSFFFILSGFILTYVYRAADGQLVMSPTRFWLLRLFRLYPIHLLTIIFTMLIMLGMHVGRGTNTVHLALSAISTITLTQSWYPPWVPMWSWPTWTISVLLFLYLIFPALLKALNKLTRRQMQVALIVLPFIALLPTVVYSFYFPLGSKPIQNWQIFVGSFPPFWLAQFFAGMVLCRFTGLSRFNEPMLAATSRFAFGDVALLLVIALACVPNIEEPIKYFFRHGLMMPLYMMIIVDLANNRGVFARLLAKKPILFLGATGYSIFIWQNLVMVFSWGAVMANPDFGKTQFYVAAVVMIFLAMASTYWIEQPISEKLRKKFLS